MAPSALSRPDGDSPSSASASQIWHLSGWLSWRSIYPFLSRTGIQLQHWIWDGFVELGEQFHQHGFAQKGDVSLPSNCAPAVFTRFCAQLVSQKQSVRGIFVHLIDVETIG